MARKRYKPEEIVAKLRQVYALVSQGPCDPLDRRERGNVLSVAPGVRWAEDRAGQGTLAHWIRVDHAVRAHL